MIQSVHRSLVACRCIVVDDCDRWSFKVFEGKWRDCGIFGTTTVKTGNKWIICWDTDNSENAMESDILFKEDDNAPIVCIGVSTPLKNTFPLFCLAPFPLKSANCPSPPF